MGIAWATPADPAFAAPCLQSPLFEHVSDTPDGIEQRRLSFNAVGPTGALQTFTDDKGLLFAACLGGLAVRNSRRRRQRDVALQASPINKVIAFTQARLGGRKKELEYQLQQAERVIQETERKVNEQEKGFQNELTEEQKISNELREQLNNARATYEDICNQLEQEQTENGLKMKSVVKKLTQARDDLEAARKKEAGLLDRFSKGEKEHKRLYTQSKELKRRFKIAMEKEKNLQEIMAQRSKEALEIERNVRSEKRKDRDLQTEIDNAITREEEYKKCLESAQDQNKQMLDRLAQLQESETREAALMSNLSDAFLQNEQLDKELKVAEERLGFLLNMYLKEDTAHSGSG